MTRPVCILAPPIGQGRAPPQRGAPVKPVHHRLPTRPARGNHTCRAAEQPAACPSRCALLAPIGAVGRRRSRAVGRASNKDFDGKAMLSAAGPDMDSAKSAMEKLTRHRWALGIAVGQIIAVVGTVSGSCAQALDDASMPMTLATANYALLAAVYGLAMLTSRQGLRNRWHNYAGIALLDVAATYLTILALQYTTVTSYALITASNLFIVVPLSRWLLRARYSPAHAAGVLLSLAGVLVLFLADRSPAPDARTADLVFGDAMLLTGSALYGLNAVWEEYILKEDAPAKELLAMLGAFGALFGGVATLLLGELWSGPAGAKHADWLRSGVVAAMFAFYSLMPAVLAWSGAAVLQMSLLASNFWAVIARLIFFDGFGGGSIWWFLVAWGLVCVGVGTYTRAGDPYRGSEGRQYARLGREEDGGGSSAPGGLELTSSGEEAWRTTGGNESGDEESGSGQAQRRGRTPAA